VRRTAEVITDSNGEERRFTAAELFPGVVIDELQVGEKIAAHGSTGTDEKIGDFQAAVMQVVAWCHEIPPEILELSFSNNYSASQAAINEFKMFLNRVRTDWGDDFCAPIYEEWLVSEVLNQKVDAPGLLQAWRDASQYDVYGAWVASEWAGQIKPAVDLTKLVNGYTLMVEQGFVTRDRAARELTGMKFSKVAKRLKVENEMLAEANAAITPAPPVPPTPEAETDRDPDEDDLEEERAV
jgi:capsid protein